MIDATIVRISDRARAVTAFSDELERVDREIEQEKERHKLALDALLVKQHALEQSILKLGAN